MNNVSMAGTNVKKVDFTAIKKGDVFKPAYRARPTLLLRNVSSKKVTVVFSANKKSVNVPIEKGGFVAVNVLNTLSHLGASIEVAGVGVEVAALST